MPYILGLTGSIGMGKSTTAAFFKDLGIPVWDADDAVHKLYGVGGKATEIIGEKIPAVIVDGAVDRARLKDEITKDPTILSFLESVVHPLVAEDRKIFLTTSDAPIVVLDIPLLFELGSEKMMDAVLVVSVPEDIQRKRVLDRGTMNEEELDTILARQLPDAQKRKKADFVIETLSLEQTKLDVQSLVKQIERQINA